MDSKSGLSPGHARRGGGALGQIARVMVARVEKDSPLEIFSAGKHRRVVVFGRAARLVESEPAIGAFFTSGQCGVAVEILRRHVFVKRIRAVGNE